MKKIFILLALVFCLSHFSLSQTVGIGTATPNSSAVLEVSSSTKGMLIPRMSTSQRNAIVSPVAGLMILNTEDLCNDIYDGSKWIKDCGLKQGDSVSIAANNWLPKSSFGGVARENAVGFSIGSKGYIGTGSTGGGNDFWEYDPATNTWAQKANFAGVSRSRAVGFSIGTKGYIGTGINATPLNDFWEYNPATNSWLQKANFSGGARWRATGFSIGSKGYLGTGYDGQVKNDFWEYDPAANAWIQKANLPANREHAISFSIGSKGYIGFGSDESEPRSEFWEYDPGIAGSSGTWTLKSQLTPVARYAAVGFSIGTKGYIGTGMETSFIKKNDFWEFNPLTNEWTQKANVMGDNRGYAVGFSIGTKGYIGTGQGSVLLNDFCEYNVDPFKVASYSTASGTLSQSNISDGIWSKSVFGQIQSNGGAITMNLNGPISFKTANTDRVIIGFNGRVGIGTNNPLQTLDVNGTIHAQNLNGGATTLSTDASGNIIRTPSDARLKNNISPIDNALNKVLQLQGHTYNFLDDKRFGTNRQMGFLAQQLETIVPEAVSSGGEYKSVNYPVLTALLAEAIKEQQKQIEELKDKAIEKENLLMQQKKDLEELKIKVKLLLQKSRNNQK